jgi:hypothetical protein
LGELLELAAVGFSTVGIAGLLVASLSWTAIPGLFDVRAWARMRGSYLGQHIGAALLSACLIAVTSCALAVALFYIFYRLKSKGIHPESSVWYDVLGRTPKDEKAWVAVHRIDGSAVEGFLYSYSYEDEEVSSIALQAPLRITPCDKATVDLKLKFIIIPGSQIESVTVLRIPLNELAQ